MFARFGGYLLGCVIAIAFAGITFAIALALGVQQVTSEVVLLATVFYFLCIGLSYAIAWLVQRNPSWINTMSVIVFVLSAILVTVVGLNPVLFKKAADFLILFFVAALFLTISLLPKGLLNFAGYVIAQTTSYDANPAIEQFWRGFNAGTNGVYAGVLAATIYSIPFFILHPLLGAAVALLLLFWFLLWPLFALLNSTDEDVKSVVGRTSFFNPTSWFMCGLGAVLFLLSFGLHWIGWAFGVPWLAINIIRIDQWG